MTSARRAIQITRTVIIDGSHCHRDCMGLNPIGLGWWCGYWRKVLYADMGRDPRQAIRCRQCVRAAKEVPPCKTTG